MSKVDRLSKTWLVIAEHCERRQEELRKQLEGSLDFEATQMTRARLRELRDILALGLSDEKLTEPDFENYS